MKAKMCVLLFLLMNVISGCATVGEPECVHPVHIAQVYPAATVESRQALIDNLRSGKITMGTTLDVIRRSYGQPDTMFVAPCNVRVTYMMNPHKRVSLWFDDGAHLSMWAD